MSQAKWWIICYDIHDPKRLRQCAKHMEGYGTRLQESVFRCWLSPTDVQRLRWELASFLQPEDEVLLIPLCSHCLDGILGIHNNDRPHGWTSQPPRYQIL